MKKKNGSRKKGRASRRSDRSRPAARRSGRGGRAEKKSPFCVVGLGASAGGLEALESFFSRMPADSGVAFVVIQHLDPEHKSMMADLLKRHTAMEVLEARNRMEAKPNAVYLIPPNRYLSLSGKKFRLSSPDPRRAFRSPVDFFFNSLAREIGEKSVGIILSGTGSDGALGLRAIKEGGGMTIVQDEHSAKYPTMPKNAIATGAVDAVLPIEEIPAELMKYIRHAYVLKTAPPESYEKGAGFLERIFALLRLQTGHDFSNYKRNTIGRRIERRMALHEIDDMGHYVKYLERHKEEVHALFKELLIGVTGFFRDPEAFDLLKERIVPKLFESDDPQRPIRIWMAGCSTGEEAYSLAMLLFEEAERKGKTLTAQIFATDIDAGALEIARAGIYPEGLISDMAPDRLKSFFLKEGNGYRVKKDLRDIVVFAKQDLIKDPPFSRLDLVVCRNLLIYFGSVLQKKILPLFHYTLNPGGFLMLGPSETIGEFADLFSLVDKKWKIFQRKSTPTTVPVEIPVVPLVAEKPPEQKRKERKVSDATVIQLTEKIVLESYAPSYVIINEKFDIIHFHRRTARYLEPPTGDANLNILKMAREGLRIELRTAIHKARKGKTAVVHPRVRIGGDGLSYLVDIIVKPLDHELMKGLMMVIFNEAPAAQEEKSEADAEPSNGEDQRVLDLEQELNLTKESLQTTIEELETSNEELKSTNEELQSTNEELQSTNEELETSKEELQSINEELVTVNYELQNKVDELSQAHNDMTNLLSSTEVATLFLDNDLKVKRFTPAVAPIFNLIPGDIGRPISNITANLVDERLRESAAEVLRTLVFKEKEVRTHEGEWYRMRINPYRTTDHLIDGVVVTFIKITDLKKEQEAQKGARGFVADLLNAVKTPLLLLDRAFKVVEANSAYYRFFQTAPEEVVGRDLFHLGASEWNLPSVRKHCKEALRNKTAGNFEIEQSFEKIGPKRLKLSLSIVSSQEERLLLLIEGEDNWPTDRAAD